MKGQLREIVENYHPAVMWFDGEWEDHWTVERGRDVYSMLRSSIRPSSSTTDWARIEDPSARAA